MPVHTAGENAVVLGILLVLGVGTGAWWSMEHLTPPPVARMPLSGTMCPEDTHVVWSRRDGRQCLMTAELRAAAQEEQPPQPRQVITLGPGVICHDLPMGIACVGGGR